MSWSAVDSWQSDASSFKSRQRYKEDIFRQGFKEGMQEIIKKSVKEAFMSQDPEMVVARTSMLRQMGVPVQPPPEVQMVPRLEDRPRHPIDEIQQMTHVMLTVPFGRMKRITVSEGIAHPATDLPEQFRDRPIPDNYTVVTPTWVHPDHREYELDHPDLQPFNMLGATECEDILWCKDDLVIQLATPTSTKTPTYTKTPTSVAGSCPPEGDPDDNNNDDNKGGDDKGKQGSPRGLSPPPPQDSPPKGQTDEAGYEAGDDKGKQPSPRGSSPPPPPESPQKGPTVEAGGSGSTAGAKKTPPTEPTTTGPSPPPDTEPVSGAQLGGQAMPENQPSTSGQPQPEDTQPTGSQKLVVVNTELPYIISFDRPEDDPHHLYPVSEDCPGHFVCGKFMLPRQELLEENTWDTRKFHLWYMEAAKRGMTSFNIKIPAKYFHLPPPDLSIPVDFKDMYRLFVENDLDIVQLTIFTLMSATISNKTRHPTLYLSPMHVNEQLIKGYEITDPKMTARQRDEKYKDNMQAAKKKISDYMYDVMKKLKPDEPHCIMAAYHFGVGLTGHWVSYIIYPQDGRACVFDSLRQPNKKGYRAFDDCLRVAYKQYTEDPECWDRRSEKRKAKLKHRIKIRRDFPCAKQPSGSNSCGLYAAQYLRACNEYTQSWKKLKEGIRKLKEIPNDIKESFKQVKSDICKFIMEKCVLEGEEFFDEESYLAYEPQYKPLRKWNTMLHPTDYKWLVDI